MAEVIPIDPEGAYEYVVYCPVCEGTDFELVTDKAGSEVEIHAYRCSACGFEVEVE